MKQTSLEILTRHDDDVGRLYSLSLQITLYAKKPLSELAAGAISCHDLFIEKFSQSLTWHIGGSTKKFKKFEKGSAKIFSSLCKKSGVGLPSFRLYSGSGIEDCEPPAFMTGAYGEFSWLQVHLPSSFADDDKKVLRLFKEMSQIFPFRYGTVGYSLCWNEMSVNRSNQVPRLIGPLLKRFPGLNIGTPREICDQGMPPVNWLTLIGPELLKELGGRTSVAKAFSKDKIISTTSLGNGILFRAGKSPQLGDNKRKDKVQVYRKVGTYLKKLRGKQEIELDGLNLKESKAWLARFDS